MKLRKPTSASGRVLAGSLCITMVLAIWQFLTYGEPTSRIVSPVVLASPYETISSFSALWFDRALTRNTLLSMSRVLKGFGLAVLIGVPIGIVCGISPIFNAFFTPISMFFRNIPMSALVPLSLLWFGIEETQKIMFIFISCVCFVIFDTAMAIASVDERYVQTSLTLGAKWWQIVVKVLVPLAAPKILGSMRLLFGLAFGYIVLAEMVNMTGGIGDLIMNSQRTGPREHVILILIVISMIAAGIDKFLQYVQHIIFPHMEK